MIKLSLANEVPPPTQKEIVMDLRQHKAASGSHYPDTHPERHYYYLVMAEKIGNFINGDQYPIKIDGLNNKIIIRKSCLEKLGFEVRVE